MAADTGEINVYRIYLSQVSGRNHEALALVPVERDNQGSGRFYHVKGDAGLGMDYERRVTRNFAAEKTFVEQRLLFKIARASLEAWEEICATTTAPHDPRALEGFPPCEDCATWIDKVLERAVDLKI